MQLNYMKTYISQTSVFQIVAKQYPPRSPNGSCLFDNFFIKFTTEQYADQF